MAVEIAIIEVPPSITGTMSDWSYAAPIPNVNVATPDFPAVAIGFARNPDNAAYDLIRFSNQKDFAHYRAMHIGVVRVIRTADDFKQVHDPILRALYSFTMPDEEGRPVGDLTHEELVGGIDIALLLSNATPYEETIMGTQAAEGTTTAPTNKTEAKAAEKAQEKAKKAQEKEAAKKQREAKRADGVIGNIKKHLEAPSGGTVDEVLNSLVTKFPDRTREGMGSTVKIQFSRLAKSTGRNIINAKIKGRGRVYKFEDQGPIPGEVETNEKPAPAPAAQPAEVAGSIAPAAENGETAETTLAEKRAAKKGTKK